MLSGLRDFLVRGNVIDLAVAFLIGAAFGTVVTSFVGDILMPLLGLLGVPEIGSLVVVTPGGAVIRYGAFLATVVSFLLVAAAIYFFVVAPMQRMRAPAEAATKTCPECATEIPLAARRCPNCTSALALQ
ncbi:MAG: large conductance mechanosensitive channel protein MscL [Chloroflexota bacterium]|nr:large conductance mechanosensitive channel protein MscL [Chloroflexota bacterium]